MKVAVLGIGLMGSAVAEGMIKAGHEVLVYNRTEEKAKSVIDKGATYVPIAADAVKAADASILVFTDGSVVRNILLTEEMLKAVKGKKILNASTTGIEEIMQFGKEIEKAEGSLAEISIMTGPDEVRNGQGYFLLGCESVDETFWMNVLSGIGAPSRVGELGAATKAEAPIVFASVFSSVMTAYAGASLIKLNVPKEVAMGTIGAMIPGAEYTLPNIMDRSYDQCFASTDSLIGVADAAISTAQMIGLPVAILEEMKQLYVTASNQGYGAKDASSIVEILLNTKK